MRDRGSKGVLLSRGYDELSKVDWQTSLGKNDIPAAGKIDPYGMRNHPFP